MLDTNRWLFFSVMLMAAATVTAVEPDEKEALKGNDAIIDDFGGIIINRTITTAGHRFYRQLTDYRRLNYPEDPHNFTVFERPSARWGSLVWIEYNGKTLFRTFMNPGKSQPEEVAMQAAQQITREFQKIQLNEKFSDHFDLDYDEFK
ncbi:Curli production assembly/transport component CsgE [Sinobacterium norvegicum]|uniref:Curli production assembly/transport component CsgE n=1 Tax=Sinobacterium norvegicum TaxID=1641715 RepID=A0ABN8EJT9_9GAMM|nr:curli production assembly/transport protein CsgE [Sinobacterium norvegicum]CAH0992675.1 Curli production assembly/transport component CsgE [Sinobacterium norvegicum]